MKRGFLNFGTLAILGLICLAVAATLVFNTYLVKKTPAPVTPSNLPLPSPTPSATTTSKTFPIPELGIKITTDEDLKDLVYVVETNSGATVAKFSTQSLISQDKALSTPAAIAPDKYYCSSEDGPVGDITKSSTKTTWEPKQVGNFYVGYTSPQAPCSDNKEVQDLQTSQKTLLEKAFQSVQPL